MTSSASSSTGWSARTRPPRPCTGCLAALGQPLDIAGLPLTPEASIGFALIPDDGADAEALLQHADVAMYLAKVGHIGVVRYDPAQDDYDSDRLAPGRRAAQGARQRRARAALPAEGDPGRRRGERRRGADPLEPPAARTALSRTLSSRSPSRPGSSTRSPTGSWTPALRQIAAWAEPGHRPVRGRQRVRPQPVPRRHSPTRVQAALAREHVRRPARCIVEITETALLTDVERATDEPRPPGGRGVPVSVDDFGRGQTSLGYLSRLPLHELKIDRSFVTDLLDDAGHAAIVRSVIDLSHNLGLVVVAEGVEDEATLARLRELACDLAQGYVLAFPMAADQIPGWLTARSSAATTRV